MTLPPIDLLLTGLHHAERLPTLRMSEWDLLIRQARQADLLARIAVHAQARGVWPSIPLRPRVHLASALQLAQRQHTELRHEVSQIDRALAPTGLPVVVLKGAAYVMADLPAARGRLVSDVDILVPRERLAEVESALMLAGWLSTKRDPYDQRYYRTWMHELPPMQHLQRGAVLDVHHAILPLTARLRPDTAQLLAASQPLPGHPRVRVLDAPDMVLHSAAHLFHEGELELGLRGLVDLESLLQGFSVRPDFWPGLLERARVLDLEGPLWQALHYTGLLLGTPTPPEVEAALRARLGRRLGGLRQRGQDALFARALRPAHPSTADAWTPLARGLLYLRGHWLRMPPWLLARHLLHKGLLSRPPAQPREIQA